MDGCVLGYPIAGFSYPLPAGKKMPAEAKKMPARLWKKMKNMNFCFFTIITQTSVG